MKMSVYGRNELNRGSRSGELFNPKISAASAGLAR
jgi:hypothetical protein